MLWPASCLVIGFSGSIWLNIWHDPNCLVDAIMVSYRFATVPFDSGLGLNPFRRCYICCDFVNNLCIRFIYIEVRVKKSSTMRTSTNIFNKV